MPPNNTTVESYLQDGCGRCENFQTPACKVHRWTDVLVAVRELLRHTDLVEEMKWGAPCYTLDGKNVVALSALVDCCTLSFFKGAALADPNGLLEAPGPNSRFARYLKFRSLDDVEIHRTETAALIEEAMELERAGVEVEVAPAAEPVPEELAERLAADAELRQAFDALTPGRRRSHILHVGGAKQSATRARRVEKCVPKILAGKGFLDR